MSTSNFKNMKSVRATEDPGYLINLTTLICAKDAYRGVVIDLKALAQIYYINKSID